MSGLKTRKTSATNMFSALYHTPSSLNASVSPMSGAVDDSSSVNGKQVDKHGCCTGKIIWMVEAVKVV